MNSTRYNSKLGNLSIRKKLSLFLVFSACMLFLNCSESVKNPEIQVPKAQVSFDKISAYDIENLGNSGDIEIQYALSGDDISLVKELRLFISKSTETIDNLLQVSSPNYQVLIVSESELLTLQENLTDTDGDLIEEEQGYTIYALCTFQDEAIEPILSEPISITLKNDIIVTTPQLSGSFNAKEDIVIANDGTLYANEHSNGGKVYKVTPEGVSSVLTNEVKGPVGITLDQEGNIYTSNFKATSIKKITPSGVVSDYATSSNFAGGGGLAFDNDGNLYNTFMATATLYRIAGGTVENFTTSALFDGPIGITFDKERDKLYVASFNTGKIFYVDKNGIVSEVADTPANIGHISYANNHFYVTGWKQQKVYKVDMSGNIVSTIGSGNNAHLDGTSGNASFTSPNGIEATADGRYVYVTQNNGKLRKIIMSR